MTSSYIRIKRYPILNIWVDDCDMDKAIKQINFFLNNSKDVKTIFASNPEKNYSVPANRALEETFKNADLLIPDGIGMVLAANWLHKASVKRVPGCELMENICELAAEKGYGIFIYGAKEMVNKAACDALMQRHPSLKVVGRQNGYLSDDQTDAFVERINASKAHILFIALGSPKQEHWVARNRNRLKHVRVVQGIGGTLDVIAGNVKRAPSFFCNVGLEWLCRLFSEPSRIKRQLKLPVFVAQVILKNYKDRFGSTPVNLVLVCL